MIGLILVPPTPLCSFLLPLNFLLSPASLELCIYFCARVEPRRRPTVQQTPKQQSSEGGEIQHFISKFMSPHFISPLTRASRPRTTTSLPPPLHLSAPHPRRGVVTSDRGGRIVDEDSSCNLRGGGWRTLLDISPRPRRLARAAPSTPSCSSTP